MGEEETYDLGEVWGKIKEFCSDKRVQWILTFLALITILFLSSSVRLSNWDLLTDSTTGEKIPLALDPYYFLRIAETIVANEGTLPPYDEMRIPGFNTPWHSEIMPNVVVGIWKLANNFGSYTLREVNVFSPVLFYGIGLIIFFFIVCVLTKSKFAGILATLFLAFTPNYLYRTMAGFSDHEAIGMIAFFGTLLGYSLMLKYLGKLEERKLIQSGICGVTLGLLTALTVATWAGVSAFIFMIVPLGFLLFWIIKLKDSKNLIKDNGSLFYVLWIIFSIIFAIILGLGSNGTVGRITSSTGIITLVVLGFVVLDRIFIFIEKRLPLKNYKKAHRISYVFGFLLLAGFILLPLIGRNFFGLLWEVLNRLLNPLWGSSRLDTTVAENAQPYLSNWISGTGNMMFFLFLFGIVLLSIDFSRHIPSWKRRILLSMGFLAMVLGILYSRISPDSILNGNGIFSLSGLVYLGGLAFFAYAFLKNYFIGKIKIDTNLIVMSAWMFVVLVTGRSTTRLFFAIAPFMCLSASYAVIRIFRYWKERDGKEVTGILVACLLIISLILSILIVHSSYNIVSNQAKHTGPSVSPQWQNAMKWVRSNTSEDAVFSHWWDYGYWIETLGERATIADGGHAQGIYGGNHKIGRYILTTPRPETALSMFKTLEVDYLLIDQTDLGKYPAYSKIGGGADGAFLDRYSAIPVMLKDPRQTSETANGTRVIFGGGSYLFEDILYNEENRTVFLPSGKAALAAIILNLGDNVIHQPEAVYIYNNLQTILPIRYLYVNEEIIDFGRGLNATVDVIPSFTGQRIDQLGAAIYLSQKVSNGLFAQLFLMNDPFDNYESIKLAHTESNPVITSIRSQGVSLGEFIYYHGFRGPIKIWNTEEIPEEIKIVEEFKDPLEGKYGSLDDLEFFEN